MRPLLQKMSAILLEAKFLSLTLPDELQIVSSLMTPNLNSKEAVAMERFLVSSFPVPRLLFGSVAMDLSMSLSEQGLPTLGNMASNLDMMDDTTNRTLGNGIGIEAGVLLPDGTWERLLT